MRQPTIAAIAAALLLSQAAPVVAQEINILGPGRGWKLQPQHGPEGQNVYSYDCAADPGRTSRRHVSHIARRTRIVVR
jgi:hypothetical protein